MTSSSATMERHFFSLNIQVIKFQMRTPLKESLFDIARRAN